MCQIEEEIGISLCFGRQRDEGCLHQGKGSYLGYQITYERCIHTGIEI